MSGWTNGPMSRGRENMSDLENLTRHGLTLGPPEMDDAIFPIDEYLEYLRHRRARGRELGFITYDEYDDTMDAMKYSYGIHPGGKDSTVISSPMVKDYWREAKLAEGRRSLLDFARDFWMGAQWLTKPDMEPLKTAFDERINEEDSMPTLINSPAGEDPAITAVDDRDRRVNIQRCNNGFVVVVGCQSIAFETSEHLCAAIKLFYEDPAKARKKYLHNPDAQ